MIHRFELFATTITQIYRELQRIKMQEMSGFHLKGTHVMCLFELNHNPNGLTVTQLSLLCGEDKAAISRTVSELQKKELVTIESQKKYRAPVLLTDTGKATANRMDELVTNAVLAGSSGLSQEEIRIFYKALTVISDNLQHYLTEEDK